MSTPPAEQRRTGIPFEEMTVDEKLNVLWEHTSYLSTTVAGLLETIQGNPAMRMMMGRKNK